MGLNLQSPAHETRVLPEGDYVCLPGQHSGHPNTLVTQSGRPNIVVTPT